MVGLWVNLLRLSLLICRDMMTIHMAMNCYTDCLPLISWVGCVDCCDTGEVPKELLTGGGTPSEMFGNWKLCGADIFGLGKPGCVGS